MPDNQNDFKFMHTHTRATWTHRQALQHVSHLVRATALCLSGQSSCRPAGPGFDHCVQEVRFVEFGPAYCPSRAQPLTQPRGRGSFTAWTCRTWPAEQTLLQELTHKNTQMHKISSTDKVNASLRRKSGAWKFKFVCKYFSPAIVWQFVGELNIDC